MLRRFSTPGDTNVFIVTVRMRRVTYRRKGWNKSESAVRESILQHDGVMREHSQRRQSMPTKTN